MKTDFIAVNDDPLMKALSTQRSISPTVLFFVFSVVLFLGAISIAIYEGLLIHNLEVDLREGLLDDFSTSLDFFLFDPLILVSLVIFYRALGKTLSADNLRSRLNAGNNTGDLQIDAIRRPLNNRGIPILALLLTICSMYLHYLEYRARPDVYICFGHAYSSSTGLYVLFMTTIVVYCVNVGVIKGLATCIVFRRLASSETLRFDVTNADERGGLKWLMQPLLPYNCFLLLCGFVIIIFGLHDYHYYETLRTTRMLICVTYYFLVFPMLFLMPYLAVHSAMKNYRAGQLVAIANEIAIIKDQILSRGKHLTGQDTERYKCLLSLLDMTRRYPRWPLSQPMLTKWLIAYLVPPALSTIFSYATSMTIP